MIRKNYKISQEVLKFPCNGNFNENDNEMLSQKFCCYIINTRKKIAKAAEWAVFYLDVTLTVANGVSPLQALGSTPFVRPSTELRFPDSVSEKIRIAPVTSTTVDKIMYTKTEIDELHQSIFSQFENGYDVQQVISTLRAGGMTFDKAFSIALTVAVMYTMYANKVQGFQAVHRSQPRFNGWGNNNHGGPSQARGYGKGAGPKSIMVIGDANSEPDRNLIQNAYNQIPTLTVEGEDLQVTAWSAAKHAHHGPAFGLDPTKYGLTQSDLDNIADVGLINHINEGKTPPNAAYVKALQHRWKAFAEHKSVRDCGEETVMGRACRVFKHDSTGLFLSFESKSKESFTGYQLSPNQSDRHDQNQSIGNDYDN